jgi:predicted DNA-binding transcriptional regulator YafY
MDPRTPNTPSNTYNLFRQAILREKRVTCTYRKHHRELCPHIIGHREGREVVLAFQFAGQSERGLPRGGQWRCLYLSEVTEARLQDGRWHTGPHHTSTQTCVETVDLDINIHVCKSR